MNQLDAVLTAAADAFIKQRTELPCSSCKYVDGCPGSYNPRFANVCAAILAYGQQQDAEALANPPRFVRVQGGVYGEEDVNYVGGLA